MGRTSLDAAYSEWARYNTGCSRRVYARPLQSGIRGPTRLESASASTPRYRWRRAGSRGGRPSAVRLSGPHTEPSTPETGAAFWLHVRRPRAVGQLTAVRAVPTECTALW